MKTRILSALVATLSLLLSAPALLAQGTAFTYQGRLDDGANPATGNFDLRFAIFDSLTSGTQQGGTLTNAPAAVSNGLFTVTLDFGASVFTGANRWLEIGVRTNGGGAFATLTPRQPLTATPYAITASNLSGTLPASKLTGTVAAANIANGSLTGAMLANGAVTSNHLAAGAVTTAALANGAVTGAKILTSFNIFSTLVLTNPTPFASDQFGGALATVGGKILVGASQDDLGATNAGVAHLFDAAGTLLVTFTNPTPVTGDAFASAVAGVGTDKVLIGANGDDTGAANAGSAYLFSTSGALLLTITNPSPASSDNFGADVTAVGFGHFLIGASHHNPLQVGAAYLYNLAGQLVQSFTNPTPANLDLFGIAVAAVGTDKVLIGAPADDVGATNAGVAHLYGTNGTLLVTYTNSAPLLDDQFGSALAAVGTDKVLIGAPQDDTGATDAGAAYLYNLNGTLLQTFTNPAPAITDQFGSAVAAVGNDRVLIAAFFDNAGQVHAGTAYLFDLAGNLIATFTNPAPAVGDQFGFAVASLDANRVVLGANVDDVGVANAGAAYVLSFDTFTPGLIADGVRAGGVDSASLADGSVTAAKIAPASVTSTMLADGAVGADQLADGAVTATKVATVSNWFAVTIANPTPANSDRFGSSVAAVGSDRVLIGADEDETGAFQAGAAYLFSTNGTLITTFTNPTPASSDQFGNSVAAVGSDRVLIGAYNDDTGANSAGAAYLFSTNGTLLTTFTNPTPAVSDQFGNSVAAVGSDRVLIAAYLDDTGASAAGAAYLFSTNGTLLTTFTNPTPANFDNFGISVAAVGSDRVLIAAYNDDTGTNSAGAAYLFSTNGTLLTTFTNPTPAVSDQFGNSVAAVGNDRVLIAANQDGTGASAAGSAYLFSTNGTLLTTFTNPTPASGDRFGNSVAAVGSDRVLIGALNDDTGASDTGAAYLFNTNGTLITTFTNPTPAVAEVFGYSVAVVGSNRVLIGTPFDGTGAANAGAAYLFSTESFTDGLVADAVRARSVITASLEDGAVTLAKLDPSIGVWTRSGNNVFRLEGNVGVGTNSPNQSLVVVGNIFATGTITPNSDRNLKTGFAPVDAAAILEKVTQLSIQQWRFLSETEGVKHVGPMAQDFRAAFGLGEIPTAIATVDADGVALAAIQGLNEKVEDRSQRSEDRSRKLEEKLQQKETEITELKERLEALEKIIRDQRSK